MVTYANAMRSSFKAIQAHQKTISTKESVMSSALVHYIEGTAIVNPYEIPNETTYYANLAVEANVVNTFNQLMINVQEHRSTNRKSQ